MGLKNKHLHNITIEGCHISTRLQYNTNTKHIGIGTIHQYRKQQRKQHYENNKEQIKQQSRQYYEDNKEQINQRKKQYDAAIVAASYMDKIK